MCLKKILIADDKEIIVEILKKEFLAHKEYAIDVAYDGMEALNKLKQHNYDLAILDVRMPKKDGISILKEIKKSGINTIVIIMTAFGTIRAAVAAMKIGAYDYITKPFDFEDLLIKVRQALALQEKMTGYTPQLQPVETTAVEEIIGASREIARINAKIQKIRNLDTTVLIIGESGTGKGIVAKKIHNASNRCELPFVHVNCAALPPNLIESELFGHEKGAFTGAGALKKGKFELADKGTIFLDEIGTLALNLQAKLLNVLQERKLERVGGNSIVPVHARIIAATNANLEEAVRRKEFREDLYYRLNVITIECPPLRFRKEDIKPLTLHFLDQFNQKLNKNISGISPDVWQILKHYDWPGNVRELENTLESAVALAAEESLQQEDLPIRLVDKTYARANNHQGLLENQECEIIKSVLEKYNGHREKSAKELGISKRTLQNKLNKFGLRYHLIKP